MSRIAPAPSDPRGAVDDGSGVVAGVRSRYERFATSPVPLVGFVVVVLAGLAALVCAMVPVGPHWVGQAGAVAVVAAYSWALAARTGGRPVVFGTVAALIGVGVQVSDVDVLHTGAAVLTCVVASLLAVMITVPAGGYGRAVAECVLAYVVAGVGALATVGFEPAVTVTRFEYAAFGLGLVGAVVLVYRLGAGLHGLGLRGIAVVAVGVVLLVITLAYAELLRRYGTPDLVAHLLRDVRWSRHHLGAFPRPIETVLGVPALVYGVRLRARLRQGWWVCAFGVAGTSAAANALVNPTISLRESGLSVVYGLVIGLVIGYVVIRLDRLVTGAPASSRGRRSRGRRSRVEPESDVLQPEPGRFEALF